MNWIERIAREYLIPKRWLVINLTPEQGAIHATNEHLLAEQMALRATTAHLVAEQGAIRATTAHLLDEQKALRATNEHLLSEQNEIKAITQRLQADQYEIKSLNEYLQREQDWLKAANAKLQAEQNKLTGGKAPEPAAVYSKISMAPGMMSKFDIEAVTQLAGMVPPGGTVVDIGSLLGLSASLWCIHSPAARIVCIDPWKYEPWLESFRDANGPITKEAFLKNVPDPRIETIQGYSPACGEGWNSPIDLYWEDGDHINPGCGESIRFWSSHVKPGGIACGHDVHLRDVRAEAEALAARWGSKLNIFGTVWWVKKPETVSL